MKNYSLWMNSSNNAEESVFDLCDLSKIKINNSITDYDAVINDANEWQKDVDNIFLIKKSITTVNHGDIITYNNQNYLVLYVPEDRDFFTSMKARLCNSTYSLKSTDTQTIVGYNEFDEPIYNTIAGTPITLPCITETSILSSNTTEAINLPDGHLLITIPYTVHTDLVEGKEFTMYGTQYQIIGIDYSKSINGVGLLVIKGRKV